MDLELLVRLMQMQMVTHTYGGGRRQDRGSVKDQNFTLILAALMDGGNGGGRIQPSRQAAPAVKNIKNTNSQQEVKPEAGVKKKEARKEARIGNKASVPDLGALVERVAAKYGLDPGLLRAVVQVESDFDPRAVSSAGAMGLMQLMPNTAGSLGVRNPFDPLENLEGGARYLRSMIERFNGDLKLALAAYNAGPGAVDYHGGVPPYRETLSYLRKINSITGGLIG